MSTTTTLGRDEQELSYRKQIARELRTQYVESIYRPKYYTMTLKSRLKVTQGHWKRNHWIDHTRLMLLPPPTYRGALSEYAALAMPRLAHISGRAA